MFSFASLELQEGFTSHNNTRLPEAGTKAKISLAPKKIVNERERGEKKKKSFKLSLLRSVKLIFQLLIAHFLK